MTCIVGLAVNNKVYIGGDSAGVAGYQITIRADQKVFTKEDMIFGFTSSFRMGQLLRYSLVSPPILPGQSTEEYLAGPWVEAVRECLHSGGFGKKNPDEGGTFLLGFKGRLFKIESDYQVGESVDGYMAAGCGDEIALGSMFTSKGTPKSRITKALQAAEYFSSAVKAPFTVLSI